MYLAHPPHECSIPALAAVWLTCRLRGATFIIDWHNFGYTILALGLRGGTAHPLVSLALAYERYFARLADAHICVTAAMRDWLDDQWGVR